MTVVGEGSSDISREYSTTRTDDGRAYVNDAGGVYEINADGSAVRVDDGVLRGVSSKMLLIRQCTSDLVCGDVLVDRTTGERRPIVDGVVPDDMQFSGYGLDLAPDGSAISGIVDAVNSQELAVVDLLTGDRLATAAQGWGRGSRWAADSSGVFESSASGTGVEFLSLAAGGQVHFADELEQVVVLTRSGNLAEFDIDTRTANIWSAPEAIAVRDPAVFRLDRQVAVSGWTESVVPASPCPSCWGCSRRRRSMRPTRRSGWSALVSPPVVACSSFRLAMGGCSSTRPAAGARRWAVWTEALRSCGVPTAVTP